MTHQPKPSKQTKAIDKEVGEDRIFDETSPDFTVTETKEHDLILHFEKDTEFEEGSNIIIYSSAIHEKASHQAKREALEECIKKLEMDKQITMIPPGKFGDGRPTRVPDSDYCKTYNLAIDQSIQSIKKLQEEI